MATINTQSSVGRKQNRGGGSSPVFRRKFPPSPALAALGLQHHWFLAWLLFPQQPPGGVEDGPEVKASPPKVNKDDPGTWRHLTTAEVRKIKEKKELSPAGDLARPLLLLMIETW